MKISLQNGALVTILKAFLQSKLSKMGLYNKGMHLSMKTRFETIAQAMAACSLTFFLTRILEIIKKQRDVVAQVMGYT